MKKIICFSALLILFFSFSHPFYLSVTDLKYNRAEKALQGSVKVFINDLEGALKKAHGQTIDLINPRDTLKIQKLLEDYLKKHLLLKINGQLKSFNLLGFENEQEAIWLYIELKNCSFPKKIEIENTVLYDHIKDQTNIMHLEVQGQKKSLKVSNPEKLSVFEF
ncbi:hypothetical protein CNR22_21245 [Sphingobacteriaceae bacterium]|nr:hypothetical protein CNR22_21245 [Sphingobacteriaceae bacterium]